MAKLFVNSEDPDQMQRSAVSDLGLHFANNPFRGLPTKWVKNNIFLTYPQKHTL